MFPFFFQHHEKLCKEKKRKNKKRQILQIPARMVRYLQLIYNSCKCLSSPLTLVSWLSSPFLELLLLDHQSLKSIHTKEISTLWVIFLVFNTVVSIVLTFNKNCSYGIWVNTYFQPCNCYPLFSSLNFLLNVLSLQIISFTATASYSSSNNGSWLPSFSHRKNRNSAMRIQTFIYMQPFSGIWSIFPFC